MAKNTIKIDSEFEEVSTHTVDGRQRVTLGDLVKDTRRVRVYCSWRVAAAAGPGDPGRRGVALPEPGSADGGEEGPGGCGQGSGCPAQS